MNQKLHPSKGLRGTVTVPGDKSISHRALMISALAQGTSTILGLSGAEDPKSTTECLQALGVDISSRGAIVEIVGKGLRGLTAPAMTLNAGNSGTSMRLLSGILTGQRFTSEITGDSSLRSRPMKRVIEPLRQMGADITGTTEQTAPLNIKPVQKLTAIQYKMSSPSAQVKSAILLAGLFADGITRVSEPVATRDHTERMLGLHSQGEKGRQYVEIQGGMKVEAREYVIPGDISAAAFLIAAGLVVPNSELLIQGIGLNPTRTALLDVFRQMGGSIVIEKERTVAGEPIGDLRVKSAELHTGFELSGSRVAEVIDEIPIIAVTAASFPGIFSVRDAKELRVKESDRIRSIVTNLRALGVDVEEYADGFAFEGSRQLNGTSLQSFGDHRIAMAFAIAGLRAKGKTEISEAESVDISFPGFWETLRSLERGHS